MSLYTAAEKITYIKQKPILKNHPSHISTVVHSIESLSVLRDHMFRDHVFTPLSSLWRQD